MVVMMRMTMERSTTFAMVGGGIGERSEGCSAHRVRKRTSEGRRLLPRISLVPSLPNGLLTA